MLLPTSADLIHCTPFHLDGTSWRYAGRCRLLIERLNPASLTDSCEELLSPALLITTGTLLLSTWVSISPSGFVLSEVICRLKICCSASVSFSASGMPLNPWLKLSPAWFSLSVISCSVPHLTNNWSW